MEKRKEIIKLLTQYMMAFPHSKMNEGALLIYSKALANLELVEIEAAMNKLIMTSKFFPTVAEIIEAVESMKEYVSKKQGAGELSAGEAWEEVQDLAKHMGVHQLNKWKFSHPAVEQAAKQFGLKDLCMLEVDGVNTARAQFRDIYNGIIQRKHSDKENQMVLAGMGATNVNRLLAAMSEVRSIEAGML